MSAAWQPFSPPVGVDGEPAIWPMWSDPVPGQYDAMTTESLGVTASAVTPPVAGARAPWRAIALIALGAFVLEMAVSARYGYVRDELYFLAAGQHLAFGYVDQPALTPLLARLGTVLGGNTVVGLRVLPALCLVAVIVLTVAISRILGAGRTGQVLAALAAATCTEFIGAAHELTTTPADFLFWTLTLYLAARLVDSHDPRWWLAIGGCVGVASEAKWNIAFLAGTLVVGLVVTGARSLLCSRYLAIGAILAAALAAPDLIWQAAHGWPALDVFRALDTQAWHNRATYWQGQVLFTGLALTPIWVAGLIWALRRQQARAFRPLAVACGLAILLQFVLGGKPYYPGAAYTFLLAAGCVPVERWLATQRALLGRIKPVAVVVGGMLVSAAVVLPVALPILPAATLRTVPLQKINYDLAESIAWPKQVALVARVYDALPPAERRQTTILTGNYGEAGAVERYGAEYGLREAYSGANNFWLWGPPPSRDTTAIAVNADPALLRREFRHVRLVATFWNGLGVSDDEEGVQIFLATGLRSSWATAWPAFRNYS
jgi:Dolichyl-phosphate-mannose-protein mannosyltransferase